jgi:oligopeptide/dipeptide ABC transporter ATP-binding protein
LADRVMVMYRGRVVETGPTEAVLAQPLHPYTQLLCESARPLRPVAPGTGGGPRATSLPIGPSGESATRGCAFAPRCRWAEPSCGESVPELVSLSPDRQSACPIRGR